MGTRVEYYVSLPYASAAYHNADNTDERYQFANDPKGMKLGSGGGATHLLVEGWKQSGQGQSFQSWIANSKKLIVHGGGESRRLPAYAPSGKPYIPFPLFPDAWGQTVDQNLLSYQIHCYEEIFNKAEQHYCVMMSSGDVLLHFDRNIPNIPVADIVAIGMSVPPDQASHFGVLLLDQISNQLISFLQKPSHNDILTLQHTYHFLVDTGAWLLSEKALRVLLKRCGWNEERETFENQHPPNYEFYSGFCLSLGLDPKIEDQDISGLSCAVLSLPNAEFYHFGTNRELIESTGQLQIRNTRTAIHQKNSKPIVINSMVDTPIDPVMNHTVWIENSFIPKTWHITEKHVLTNIPANSWDVRLAPGDCIDFVPVDDDRYCIRIYGIDDGFSGSINSNDTVWIGKPAIQWFQLRNLDVPSERTDIQYAKLFPILHLDEINSDFIQWLISQMPADNQQCTVLWNSLPKYSADDLRYSCNIERLMESKRMNQAQTLVQLYKNDNLFYWLDLHTVAHFLAPREIVLEGQNHLDIAHGSLERVHDLMYQAIYKQIKNEAWQSCEREAFEVLRDTILGKSGISPVDPKCCIFEDQIVWGRSPIRFDLAGGWTDTPPYCIEHGGKVVNMAVTLNGQPPVQIFAKLNRKYTITIRSIDLGVEQLITQYEDLRTYAQPGSEFALAKAAMAIAGFLPEFKAGKKYAALTDQLKDFGGGLEISLLAAIPAGSGLGTSSILGTTLLGVIGELCGYQWSRDELMLRTLIVEQLLTTGGGWQDQAGGITPGVKLVETVSGIVQQLIFRWLPPDLFLSHNKDNMILVYYTGITRMAKGILQEIVRGMFLNDRERLRILDEMQFHAVETFDSIQRKDWDKLCCCVEKSWNLNQSLDSGTNTPEVQAILGKISDNVAGAKLLGAGGGGYMVIFAKDQEAGKRIKRTLSENPPNDRARFVNFDVSDIGLEITKS